MLFVILNCVLQPRVLPTKLPDGRYFTKSNYKFETYPMKGASRQDMYREEQRHIKSENPIANRHPGGNGPR